MVDWRVKMHCDEIVISNCCNTTEDEPRNDAIVVLISVFLHILYVDHVVGDLF